MIIRSFLLGLSLIAVIGSAHEAQPLYDMYFYVKEGRWGDPNLVGIEGHPCGSVLPMRLSRIPEFPENGPIQPSEIVEFDHQNEIVQRWYAPADYGVQAVSGDRILLNIHGDGWSRFWVGADGTLEPSERGVSVDTFQLRSCPATIRTYYDSDNEGYPDCAVFIDELDGTERQFAFESVCT